MTFVHGLIALALVVSHGGAAYLGYKKGAKVAAAAATVKTDVGAIKKIV